MLRSRVDEPIYLGYIPFHTVIVLPLQPSEIEVALLEEPVQMSECFRQTYLGIKIRVWKEAPLAGIEPRSPRTEFYEANALPLY